MLFVKPHYYDRFVCAADQCPDTCCAGWQIMVDEDSLLKYSKIRGGFGNRIMTSIDWNEGAFLQYNRRCCFLNDDNLCDLYEELGEDSLCATCRTYPRHVEEFDGVREFSLSMSCPEAARMILESEEPLSFTMEENSEEETEEYEDFDYLLYSKLTEIRDVLFRIVQNRQKSWESRMKQCMTVGWLCQSLLDEGMLFESEEKLGDILHQEIVGESLTYNERKSFFQILFRMEVLREGWQEEIRKAYSLLYGKGEKEYLVTNRAFVFPKWEQYAGQMLASFLYTYFCGAVYDQRILSKVCFAVYSTRVIYDFCLARWLQQGGKLEKSDVWSIVWEYAREVEHSDRNLEILEVYFASECCVRGRKKL